MYNFGLEICVTRILYLIVVAVVSVEATVEWLVVEKLDDPALIPILELHCIAEPSQLLTEPKAVEEINAVLKKAVKKKRFLNALDKLRGSSSSDTLPTFDPCWCNILCFDLSDNI